MNAHQRDFPAGLRMVQALPTNAAAGTFSSAPFKFGGAACGWLGGSIGLASGTPAAQTLTVSLLVAPDDGAGAPGTFEVYTGPDGVAASLLFDTDRENGTATVHLEGTPFEPWGLLRMVVTLTGGTAPRLPVSAFFAYNDSQTPARAAEFYLP